MNQTLESLSTWLNANYRAAFLSLQPGLSDADIDAQLSDWPSRLPDDVRTLYRWRDGFEDENVQLLPGLSFLPLENAAALAAAFRAASAEQAKKSGAEFFPAQLLPIFSSADNELVLLVQGYGDVQPASPAQVVYLSLGRRLYGFERLEDLFRATLELFQSGVYLPDHAQDTVSIVDEAAAQATWRRYPLLYIENVDPAVLAQERLTQVQDAQNDEDDEEGGDLLVGLLDMLGLDPADVDPQTATLEDLQEMQELVPVEDWPEALQGRYRELSSLALEAGAPEADTDVPPAALAHPDPSASPKDIP